MDSFQKFIKRDIKLMKDFCQVARKLILGLKMLDYNKIRREYRGKELSRKELISNPFRQLEKWLEEAHAVGIHEVNAMILTTASKNAKPSCRTILVKEINDQGLVFFTNMESRKAKELTENPQAAGLFLWEDMHRQVCVEGVAEKVDSEVVIKYFEQRPRGSKLATWASHQDQLISSRQELENAYASLEKKYADNQDIPLPSYWGGFRLVPTRFEFWQGRENRLHDRFQYIRKENDEWKIDRLSP